MTCPRPPYPARPRVAGSELRPGLLWYGIAGVLVAVGVVMMLAAAAWHHFGQSGRQPVPWIAFGAGTPASLELRAGTTWAIYVDADVSPDEPDAYATRCLAGGYPGAGEITLKRPARSFDFASGDRHWHLVYEVTVSKDGDYKLECDPDGPNVVGDHYSVGAMPDPTETSGRSLASLTVPVGLSVLVVAAGGGVALVVAVRRAASRRRLLAERGAVTGAPAG